MSTFSIRSLREGRKRREKRQRKSLDHAIDVIAEKMRSTELSIRRKLRRSYKLSYPLQGMS